MKGALSLTLAILAGCLDPFEPPLGTYRFEPPHEYRLYWQSVEDCSGLRGNFDRVRWFAVPQTAFRCPTARGQCGGLWREPHDIYIVEAAPYILVAHEMLHDLLQRGDHPEVFRTCGLLRNSPGEPVDTLLEP